MDNEGAEVTIAVYRITYTDRNGEEQVIELPSLLVHGRVIAYDQNGLYDQPQNNVPQQPVRMINIGRTLLKLATISVKIGLLVEEYQHGLNPKTFVLKAMELILTETPNAIDVAQELADYDWSDAAATFASLCNESSRKSLTLLDRIILGFIWIFNFFHQLWMCVYNYFNREPEPEVNV